VRVEFCDFPECENKATVFSYHIITPEWWWIFAIFIPVIGPYLIANDPKCFCDFHGEVMRKIMVSGE
jgi:hypothetical protein